MWICNCTCCTFPLSPLKVLENLCVYLKRDSENFALVLGRIIQLFTHEVCTFLKKVAYNLTYSGIKKRAVIGEKQWQIRKSIEENFYYFKKPSGNEHKMKNIYLLRKPWSPMILSCYLILTQHDKWLVKSCWKTLQFLRHAQHSSIKSGHSETLYSVPFWNWKQCTAIIKGISSTWNCNPLSVTEIFCWKDPEKFRTIKLLTKNACVTSITHKSLEPRFQ